MQGEAGVSVKYEVARILNEKLKFEEENYALKEKVNNQSYLISELSAKVKDLENERSSLLTVVRILQTEADNATQEWKTVEPRRQNQTDKSRIGHATTVKDGKYQTTNRYEILSDTTAADSEVNEIVDYHERNNESRRMTAKHRYGKSSNVSMHMQTTSTSSLTRTNLKPKEIHHNQQR
ncbi:Hypothetical predicted protein, partial [Paramuricea clavata]